MSSTSTTILPERLLTSSSRLESLMDIATNFDPNSYEEAVTRYRKPQYQRGIDKSMEWNESLIESVVRGRSIGAIVISKWDSVRALETGGHIVETFYNIEDGGTRINAIYKYVTGKITHSEYGKFADNIDIQRRFNEYTVSVNELSKRQPQLTDSEYYRELCENFSLLQESTSLSGSDRLCALATNEDKDFPGSPIVNFTIYHTKRSSDYKEHYGLFSIGPRGKRRDKTAFAVSIVAGIIFGPKYCGSQYMMLKPIIYKPSGAFRELTEEMLSYFEYINDIIIGIYKETFNRLSRMSREPKHFDKMPYFLGPMIADIWDILNNAKQNMIENGIDASDLNEYHLIDTDDTFYEEYVEPGFQLFRERWLDCITEFRKVYQKYKSSSSAIDYFLREEVYNKYVDDDGNRLLGEGDIRNCVEANLIGKMKAVREWHTRFTHGK